MRQLCGGTDNLVPQSCQDGSSGVPAMPSTFIVLVVVYSDYQLGSRQFIVQVFLMQFFGFCKLSAINIDWFI